MQEDARLAVFQAFLNEDWPVSTLTCLLRGRVLQGQPAPVLYIHYPSREGGKGDAPCWLCLAKAMWIAEAILGPRPPAISKRFEEVLSRSSLQV